jgi:biopolymer transport protein ExbB
MKLVATPYLKRSLWVALIIGLILCLQQSAIPVHAQDKGASEAATATTAAGGVPAEAQKSKTLWGIIKDGGWIMIPLSLISLWCTGLIIEGFVRIRLPNFVPADQLRLLKQAFGEENYQQAWRICKTRPTFLTNVLRHGLERLGRGRAACESAIGEHSLKESMLYKTRVSYLSTIGVVSPMVGLLGTVTGMIKAFQTLGTGGIADPSRLAAAIGEVLIATATGLMVAIPAFFLYYFFRNRLQQVIILAEDAVNQLMGDVKYDELQGVRIGEVLEAELAGGAPAPMGAGGNRIGRTSTPDMGKRLSQVVSGVSMACPQCSSSISAGAPKCNSCGIELQWT